jgi:hypothetical protein
MSISGAPRSARPIALPLFRLTPAGKDSPALPSLLKFS